MVDLETTGTDPKTDAIIQVGAVLLQGGKIISRFSCDLNPGRKIPKHIEALTGITNAKVKKAPLFSDIAETLYGYLQGTIFVAHNIAFDYRFLNDAFERLGLKPLNLSGIDTVLLSQIFFPTEVSFRLKDLAESFGFNHLRPHQADSDAEVTAKLFLKIEETIDTLPAKTLEKISELAQSLPFETGDFILQKALKAQTQVKDLSPSQIVLEGLVIQNKTLEPTTFQKKSNYPRGKKGKEKVFPKSLTFRKTQSRMMNLVYDFLTADEKKNYLLEAPPGIGKTMGYLFPLSFLIDQKHPAVIATSTLVLQEQILKEVERLNEGEKEKISATIIKSPSHYLDLYKFNQSLRQINTRQTALYQMMILVWLTQTVTGDLSELNLLRISDPFFQTVVSNGQKTKNPFSQQDFYYWVKKRALASEFLITNHAYLIEEEVRDVLQLPKSTYLIIDEAHHFPHNILQQKTSTFSFSTWQKELETLKIKAQDQGEYFYKRELFLEIEEGLTIHLNALENYFRKTYPLDYPLVMKEKNLPKDVCSLLETLKVYFQDFLKITSQFKEDDLSLQEAKKQGELFLAFWQNKRGKIQWLEKKKEQLFLASCDYESLNVEKNPWYKRYEKIIYTGATLQSGTHHLLQNHLNLQEVKSSTLLSPFDYKKQLRFYLPEEITEDNGFELLVKTLKAYIQNIHEPLLVLFSSQVQLKKCYEAVQSVANDQMREVLAQGVNGTKEKLLKRFSLSDEGILLGNETFWEGVDLPGKKLPVIMVAKLPFENPQQVLVALRYETIEKNGGNAFLEDALPTCNLRLKQAFGRLLRFQEDKGVLMLFDGRYKTKSYGKYLQKHLPQGLKEDYIPENLLLSETKDFLTEKEEDDE